jgi:hypothetical protein
VLTSALLHDYSGTYTVAQHLQSTCADSYHRYVPDVRCSGNTAAAHTYYLQETRELAPQLWCFYVRCRPVDAPGSRSGVSPDVTSHTALALWRVQAVADSLLSICSAVYQWHHHPISTQAAGNRSTCGQQQLPTWSAHCSILVLQLMMVAVRPGLGVVLASTEAGGPLNLLHCYHAIISALQRQPFVLVPFACPLLSHGQHGLASTL